MIPMHFHIERTAKAWRVAPSLLWALEANPEGLDIRAIETAANPEGWQKVAGGSFQGCRGNDHRFTGDHTVASWRDARTVRIQVKPAISKHDPGRASQGSGTPSGCARIDIATGGIAGLNHRLLSVTPSVSGCVPRLFVSVPAGWRSTGGGGFDQTADGSRGRSPSKTARAGPRGGGTELSERSRRV